MARYEKEGEAFVDKYRAMLKATTVSHVEDVAAMVGIDLQQRSFWEESLATCKERIDEFLELTKGLL